MSANNRSGVMASLSWYQVGVCTAVGLWIYVSLFLAISYGPKWYLGPSSFIFWIEPFVSPPAAFFLALILLVYALLMWRSREEVGDQLLLMRRALPLPLRLVGLHTPVWTNGQLVGDEPVEERVIKVPCVFIEQVPDGELAFTDNPNPVHPSRCRIAPTTYLRAKGDAVRIDLNRARFFGLRVAGTFRYIPARETVTVFGMVVNEAQSPKKTNREAQQEVGGEEDEIKAWLSQLESPQERKRVARSETRLARRGKRKSRRPRSETQESKPSAAEDDRLFTECHGMMIVSRHSRGDLLAGYERQVAQIGMFAVVAGVLSVAALAFLFNGLIGVLPPFTWASLFACLVLSASVVGSIVLAHWFNRFAQMRALVAHAWAGIGVEAKRRAELVPELARILRETYGQEKRLATEVGALRAQIEQANQAAWGKAAGEAGVDRTRQHLVAEEQCRDAVGRLFVRLEGWPALKSNQSVQRLFAELLASERRVEWARAYYNQATSNYNALIERTPAAWVAQAAGYTTLPLWQESSSTRVIASGNGAFDNESSPGGGGGRPAKPRAASDVDSLQPVDASIASVPTASLAAAAHNRHPSHAPPPERAWYVAAALFAALVAGNIMLLAALL